MTGIEKNEMRRMEHCRGDVEWWVQGGWCDLWSRNCSRDERSHTLLPKSVVWSLVDGHGGKPRGLHAES